MNAGGAGASHTAGAKSSPGTEEGGSASKASLLTLLTALPAQLIALGRAELSQAKLEIVARLKRLGVGLALIVLALFLLFFALATLVAAAVAGIAVALPVWAAALIVAVALVCIAAGLIWLGVHRLQQGNPVPEETISSIEQDFRTISEGIHRGN